MKKAVSLAVIALTFMASSGFAMCGTISYAGDRFYIQMGGASAQLVARDSWIGKPLRDLQRSIGTEVCVEGEWVNNYVFDVWRVDKR